MSHFAALIGGASGGGGAGAGAGAGGGGGGGAGAGGGRLVAVSDGATLAELPALLKRWMALQEEAASLSVQLKEKRVQSKALKEVILRIMESNKVAALNVSKGTVMHKVMERAETMTDAYLLKHCKEFFGGDEARARSLVEYLESHRSTTVRHDLRLHVPKGGLGDETASNRS
jgi:hypothetical protein